RLRMRTGFHRPENKASSDRKLQAECLNYESDAQPVMTQLLGKIVWFTAPSAQVSAFRVGALLRRRLISSSCTRRSNRARFSNSRVPAHERPYRAWLMMSPW